MKKALIFGMVAVGTLAANESANATVIYHELFGNTNLDGSNSKLGWWYQLDYSGAHTKYSETGSDPWGNSYNGWDIGGPGASGGADVGVGSINSIPLKPDSDSNGYNYLPLGAANASLLYTNEYVIDLAQWTNFKTSFFHEDDAVGTTFRMLVGVAATSNGVPTWYVSNAAGTVTATGWTDESNPGRLYIDTTGSTWYTVTADYTVGSLVGALPGGYAVAFGVQTQNSVTTNRFDNFMVEATAVPEPSSVTLFGAGVGLAAASWRRRK